MRIKYREADGGPRGHLGCAMTRRAWMRALGLERSRWTVWDTKEGLATVGGWEVW